jgi:heme o synthase
MNRYGAAQVAGTIRRVDALPIRLMRVAKAPLCCAVAVSALFGYLLTASRLDAAAATLFFSVLVLACGAASLNSYQDYRYDRLLQRTRCRPLACGDLPAPAALLQAGLLLAAGTALLLLLPSPQQPLLVALAVVVLYNGIYTPLKYKTTWALIPGALCGALPPYIGWLAGGGSPMAEVIFIGMAVLALWQVPHFWLVLLEHREDYRSLPLPSMISLMSEKSLCFVAFIWVLALVSTVHSLLLIRPLSPAWLVLPISVGSLAVVAVCASELFGAQPPRYRLLFLVMNAFLLLVMSFFSIGSLGLFPSHVFCEFAGVP